MKQRKKIVSEFKDKGLPVIKGVQIAGISRSSFYYKGRNGKRGRRPHGITVMEDGTKVPDRIVLSDIKNLLGNDFVDYGYIKVTQWLVQKGYIINKKKVYRLMKENKLLHSGLKPSSPRDFVKFTRALPENPFEILEMDIKFVYIHGTGQNALLLTILDTFNRKALVWKCKYRIRKQDVKKLIEKLILKYLQPYDLLNKKIKVTIRSDNGSQFIAKVVREFLENNSIAQEFTRPATPEQNGHIESFHSILNRLVCEKFEIESLYHLREILENFFSFYNEDRIHSSICHLSPDNFQWAWENELVQLNEKEKKPRKRFTLLEKPYEIMKKRKKEKNCNFKLSDEAETGSAGEHPVRNNLTDEDKTEGGKKTPSVSLINQSSLSEIPEKNSMS